MVPTRACSNNSISAPGANEIIRELTSGLAHNTKLTSRGGMMEVQK